MNSEVTLYFRLHVRLISSASKNTCHWTPSASSIPKPMRWHWYSSLKILSWQFGTEIGLFKAYGHLAITPMQSG